MGVGGWGGSVGVGVEGKQGMGWRNDEDGVEVIPVSALFRVVFVCFCFVRGYLCLFLLCSRLPLFISALFEVTFVCFCLVLTFCFVYGLLIPSLIKNDLTKQEIKQ